MPHFECGAFDHSATSPGAMMGDLGHRGRASSRRGRGDRQAAEGAKSEALSGLARAKRRGGHPHRLNAASEIERFQLVMPALCRHPSLYFKCRKKDVDGRDVARP